MGDSSLDRLRGREGTFCGFGIDRLAASHSFTSIKALTRIFGAKGITFSKIALFLAVHRFHSIHGAKGESVRPMGGRFIAFRVQGSKSRREEAEGSKSCIEIGAISQTCWAIGQLNKTCIIVSNAPQCLHGATFEMPLKESRLPTGRASLRDLQRKCWSFFDVFTFNTFCIQLKEGVALLGEASLYPDLEV